MNTYQCVVMNIVSTYKPFCLHHLIILEDFFLWTILKTQTNLKRGTARSSLSLCDMAHEMLPRNKTPVHLELPVHLKNRSNASIAHDLSKRPFQIQGVFSSMLITQQRSVSVTASQGEHTEPRTLMMTSAWLPCPQALNDSSAKLTHTELINNFIQSNKMTQKLI